MVNQLKSKTTNYIPYETIMIFQIAQRNEYKIMIASSPLKNKYIPYEKDNSIFMVQ